MDLVRNGKTYQIIKSSPPIYVTEITNDGLNKTNLYLQWNTIGGTFNPIGVLSIVNSQDGNYGVPDRPIYNLHLRYTDNNPVRAPSVDNFIDEWYKTQSNRGLDAFMSYIQTTQQKLPNEDYGGGKGSRPTAKVTEWKSTGRKVKVEGGRHKLVYRNRAGDLRVRKVTVNKQGHRVTRYVKY
jgi:hypothetical protein